MNIDLAGLHVDYTRNVFNQPCTNGFFGWGPEIGVTFLFFAIGPLSISYAGFSWNSDCCFFLAILTAEAKPSFSISGSWIL